MTLHVLSPPDSESALVGHGPVEFHMGCTCGAQGRIEVWFNTPLDELPAEVRARARPTDDRRGWYVLTNLRPQSEACCRH